MRCEALYLAGLKKGERCGCMATDGPLCGTHARKHAQDQVKRKSIPPAHTLLEIHMRELGLEFDPEFRFHPERRWRFDYRLSHPFHAVALEIEGGVYSRGRHVRGTGFMGDLEKYRMAAAMGYKVYRFATSEVMDGTAREFLREHCK